MSPRLARVAFGVSLAVNLVVLYWPRQVSDGGFSGADKLVHAAIFAAVTATGWRAGLPVRWLLGALVAHAVSSELVQHWFLAHRSGDPADVAADVAGIAMGAVVAALTGHSGGSWHRDLVGRGPRADRTAARRGSGPG